MKVVNDPSAGPVIEGVGKLIVPVHPKLRCALRLRMGRCLMRTLNNDLFIFLAQGKDDAVVLVFAF